MYIYIYISPPTAFLLQLTISKMAKFALTLAALFLLLAFSHARTPSDLPAKENGRDQSDTKIYESEAEPTTASSILLPSEKPDSDPATVVKRQHDASDPKLSGPTILANEESTEFKESRTVPLTVVSFRPGNRHFPRRPFPLSFRHGRPCRHGHRQFRSWTPRFHGGDHERDRDVVSYGDDMILSSAGDDMGFDQVFHGGPRQIPARWVNFRHGGPRFPFRHDDDMDLERPHHHHHRHHHEHDHDRREEFEGMPWEHKHEHERREHGGGLMRRFRKFLNHF